MGSLLGGWDSPVAYPQTVQFEKNKSLTKDEINAYWSSRKKNEDEHLRSISPLSRPKEKVQPTYERSNSLPDTNTEGGIQGAEDIKEAAWQKLINEHGWWTRSNSAFLNEPPVMATDTNSNRYVSQFHISAVK